MVVVVVAVVMTREEGVLAMRDRESPREKAEVEEGAEDTRVEWRRCFGRTPGVGSECFEGGQATAALARRRRISFRSDGVRGCRGPVGRALMLGLILGCGAAGSQGRPVGGTGSMRARVPVMVARI